MWGDYYLAYCAVLFNYRQLVTGVCDKLTSTIKKYTNATTRFFLSNK